MTEKLEEIVNQIVAQEYAVIDFLVAKETLLALKNNLITHKTTGDFRQAGTGNKTNLQINELIRTDKILWIDDNSTDKAEQDYLATATALKNYLNQSCYTGIRNFEVHYACFEAGAFYKPHFDRFKNDDLRKMTLITYLNEDWTATDGGELVLHFNNSVQKILPLFGRSVIFRSHEVLHEVLPAKRERMSITGWMK